MIAKCLAVLCDLSLKGTEVRRVVKEANCSERVDDFSAVGLENLLPALGNSGRKVNLTCLEL